MRLHRRVRLHLRAIAAPHRDLGGLLRGLHGGLHRGRFFAPRTALLRPPDVAILRHAPTGATSARRARHVHRLAKHQRRPRLLRIVCIDDKRQYLKVDFDLGQRGLRFSRRGRRYRRNRLAVVAHNWHEALALLVISGLLRAAQQMRQDHHSLDARLLLGLFGVDAEDARVRMRRAQDPPMQHPRPLHIGGVARASGYFVSAIGPRHRLAHGL